MGNEKKVLFGDDDSEEEVTIKTENDYAKKYDVWRGKEEIHKLEQKYGSKALDPDASQSSDSEDESDESLEESEEMEKQFLKTLALLKTKDPRIYDPKFQFFEEKNDTQGIETKKKELKFEDSDAESSDDDGAIFKIEKKASEIVPGNKLREERKVSDSKDSNIKEFLTGKVEHLDDPVEKDLEPLKALWSNPDLNEGEAFLRDYILNKKYLEEGDAGAAEGRLRDDEELEQDQQTVEQQNQFERAYNFRFEEPDDEYLKRYPRTMSAIRPKDDRRSRKRAEMRARKEQEKLRKMEEIARLKALKLQEIREKLEKIREVTGNKELAFREEDIESDFDPDAHDRRMRAVFDERYYGAPDTSKPAFPDLDDELEIENWEKYEKEAFEEQPHAANGDVPHCEDDDFNMDADYDPKQARNNLMDEIKQTLGKKRRNRRKKSKLAEILETEKPKYIPEEDKTYSQYMEEYYKMDCEDVIAGEIPTRFKYRQVVPNDYGLTVEEILLADDRELTQWVPIKKIVKHRGEAVERSEVNTYRQKAADPNIKRKILPSLFKELPEEPELVVPVQETLQKKKKKKNKQNKSNSDESNVETQDTAPTEEMESSTLGNDDAPTETKRDSIEWKKTRRKNKRKDSLTFEVEEISPTENNTQNSSNLNKAKEENNEKSQIKAENTAKLNKTQKVNGFTVESVESVAVTPQSSRKKQKKKNLQASVIEQPMLNTVKKHKLDNSTEINQVPNKMKKRKSNHEKNKNFTVRSKKYVDVNSDPMAKLSDERLKAYGLNPKKYRGFLKYKKY